VPTRSTKNQNPDAWAAKLYRGGGFAAESYWSPSQFDALNAEPQRFGGGFASAGKDGPNRVRPVRAF